MDNNLIELSEIYVKQLFERNNCEKLIYHNINHTINVVERCNEIAGCYNITDNSLLVLNIAAWFHGTGRIFSNGQKEDVEKSTEIMKEFMLKNNAPQELISEISKCILATNPPSNPANLEQQILCDAETYNFGSKKFKAIKKQIHAEYNLLEEETDNQKWNEIILDKLINHSFYTQYCRDILTKSKKENILKLRNKLIQEEKAEMITHVKNEQEQVPSKEFQNRLRYLEEKQNDLNEKTDHKAYLLILVNAIILSVIPGFLIVSTETNIFIIISTTLLMIVVATTIIIALFACIPDKKNNPPFPEGLNNVSFEQFKKDMLSTSQERGNLFEHYMTDIFFTRALLERKQKLLRIAILIFISGVTLFLLLFLSAIIMNNVF